MSDTFKRRERAEIVREWAKRNIDDIKHSLVTRRDRPVDLSVHLELIDLLFPEDIP